MGWAGFADAGSAALWRRVLAIARRRDAFAFNVAACIAYVGMVPGKVVSFAISAAPKESLACLVTSIGLIWLAVQALPLPAYRAL